MKRTRGRFRATILVLSAVFAFSLPPQVQAEPINVGDEPSALAMFGDALFVRPIMAAGTVVGTALFTVMLPFTALGGDMDDAAEVLVKVPARTTFLRCLGCTPEQDARLEAREKRLAARAKKQAGQDHAPQNQ